jgi:hypothetical protein
MKPKHRFPALATLVFASAVWTCQSIAATIDKADNTNDPILTTSWSGAVVPGAADQNLTISSNLTLAQGAQSWNVASGRTLALDTGTSSRSADSTLNLQGAGTVSSSMTGLSNVNSVTHP